MDAQLQISDSILIKENISYTDGFKIECVSENPMLPTLGSQVT